MVGDHPDWIEQARLRARVALRSATAPGDRLALIRELARLSGGRLDLGTEALSVSEEERALLRRFELAEVGDGALRLTEGRTSGGLEGLATALRVDVEPRTIFAEAAADAALVRIGRHRAYRSETQRAAVSAMLTMPPSASLMVSMPTGSGKSLLFQLGPLLWRREDPGACAIVFTPTVALAHDHERTLRRIPGLEASRALTGGTSVAERTVILNAFRRGKVPVLLLSPEAAFGTARESILEAAAAPELKFGLMGRLVAVFVDEAHVVESWGRTFRPEFQRLPALIDALRTRNPGLRTCLLSATLTQAARTLLRRSYGGGAWLEVHAHVPRYDFDVVASGFDDDAARDEVLLSTLDLLPRPAIVYVTRVRDAEHLHARLVGERGYRRVALFTGDMTDAGQRRAVIEAWSADEVDLVVATSAFGLGIDKADVRAVVHACLPESASRWYQEVGRAARDRHQGMAVTLWTRSGPGRGGGDEDQAFYMASASWLSRDLAVERWDALRKIAELGWEGPWRRLRLPLDAARPALGPRTGEKNRRWNMSLLNLMQRAGTIRIDVPDPTSDRRVWDLVLIDDDLLAAGPALDAVWDRIFALREAERSEAVDELVAFRDLVSGSVDECLLRGVFGLIEPDAGDVADCGRCPRCRRRGVAKPGRISPDGLDRVWPSYPDRCSLPTGLVVIDPTDPALDRGVPALLDRLVSAGIEQFVVPDRLLDSSARHLAGSKASFGFLFALSDCATTGRVHHALPTAVLVGDGDDVSLALRSSDAMAARHPEVTTVLVASPRRLVHGRALSQVASILAPFEETSLDEFSMLGQHA